MRAVILGAGRVGCAAVGSVLARAGHEVVFVNRDPAVTERINRHHAFVVDVAENGRVHRERVDGVRALRMDDQAAVTAAIAGADLVATAVGAAKLPAVAPVLAAGLSQCAAARNVVAFENAVDAGSMVRRLVLRDRALRLGTPGTGRRRAPPVPARPCRPAWPRGTGAPAWPRSPARLGGPRAARLRQRSCAAHRRRTQAGPGSRGAADLRRRRRGSAAGGQPRPRGAAARGGCARRHR